MPKYSELVPCELCDEALSWRHILTANGYVCCASCRPKAERLEAKPAKAEPPPKPEPPLVAVFDKADVPDKEKRERLAKTESAPMSGKPLCFLYRNHKGEVAERRVLPRLLRFGISEDHPDGRYLLEADDLDRQAPRTFALESILRLGPPPDADHLLPIDPAWLHEIAATGITAMEIGKADSGADLAIIWCDRHPWAHLHGKGALAGARLLNSLSPRVANALAVLIQGAGASHDH